MGIVNSSLASGVAAGVQNAVFQSVAGVIPRNIAVIGTGLPASYTANGVVVNTPQLITSPSQAAVLYGAGSNLHRLILAAFAGTNGAVPVYAIPETETGAAAAGVVTFTASTPTAGTLNLYINGTKYSISTATTDTPTTLSTKAQALINADSACPVTAAGTTTLTLTAKSKGLYGNFITVAIASQPGDTLPSGVGGSVTTPMATGSGVPTMATTLTAALGTGSAQNLLPNGQWITDLVHDAMQDATTITAISTYNGIGDQLVGNYDNLVGRPFRCLMGDISLTSQPSTVIATATSNIYDRTNGIIAVPGSLTHPAEIAATAIGVMARINLTRAEQNYIGLVLPGVDPGYAAATAGTRYTDQYTNRDLMVQGGVSPTLAQGGSVIMQNVCTFYHPASVPVTSNIYREMTNISKIQNILANVLSNFKSPKWTGYTIVSDVKNVTVTSSRTMARDVGSVQDDWLNLINSFAANAWIYNPAFSIKALTATNPAAISVRTGGDGFNCTVPFILSGVGNIINAQMNMDISIAAANV